jgi:hypothetical protein
MKIDSAEKYLKQFKARGLKMKGKTRKSDTLWMGGPTFIDLSYRVKMDNEKRFVGTVPYVKSQARLSREAEAKCLKDQEVEGSKE